MCPSSASALPHDPCLPRPHPASSGERMTDLFIALHSPAPETEEIGLFQIGNLKGFSKDSSLWKISVKIRISISTHSAAPALLHLHTTWVCFPLLLICLKAGIFGSKSCKKACECTSYLCLEALSFLLAKWLWGKNEDPSLLAQTKMHESLQQLPWMEQQQPPIQWGSWHGVSSSLRRPCTVVQWQSHHILGRRKEEGNRARQGFPRLRHHLHTRYFWMEESGNRTTRRGFCCLHFSLLNPKPRFQLRPWHSSLPRAVYCRFM